MDLDDANVMDRAGRGRAGQVDDVISRAGPGREN